MKRIPLTQGKFALVDDADFEMLHKSKWWVTQASGLFYVGRWVKGAGKNEYMHRVLLNPKEGKYVDHIDGNGLNNQRSNLRICDRGENNRNRRISKNNTSGFKGARWSKRDKRWGAYIRNRHEYIYLGHYLNPEEAYLAYCLAAHELHGEFAHG